MESLSSVDMCLRILMALDAGKYMLATTPSVADPLVLPLLSSVRDLLWPMAKSRLLSVPIALRGTCPEKADSRCSPLPPNSPHRPAMRLKCIVMGPSVLLLWTIAVLFTCAIPDGSPEDTWYSYA